MGRATLNDQLLETIALDGREESRPFLERLPEGPLQVLEGRYQQLLENTRHQAGEEAAAARKSVDQAPGTSKFDCTCCRCSPASSW